MEVRTRKRMTQSPERVWRERVKAGLEQNQLAEKVGISGSLMSRIESGQAIAKASVLLLIAEALACDIEDLMPAESTAA